MTHAIRIFSTCPPSVDVTSKAGPGLAYRDHVAAIARWSEAAGCEGILVYADNRLVDPWLVAQGVIGATERLCPLVAVQPAASVTLTLSEWQAVLMPPPATSVGL